jgi:signal transduction histidine kinase
VLIVDRRGRVLADSTGEGSRGQDYSNRPEIASALRGKGVQEERHSNTLDEDLLATTVPVLRGGRPAGAVRVTQSVEAVGRSVRRSILGLGLLGLVVLALGLGVGLLIARRIAQPVRRLDETARLVAIGDLERRAPIEGSKEQRSLARSFNTMTERLATALQGQRRFVADASHQLRTPLTGLRLRLEEARAASDDAEVREEIDAGTAEVDRLAAMVEELLLLSRAGARDARPERLDLGAAARDAAGRWEGAAREAGIDLQVTANGAAPVTASPPALERAVDVLVENAIRYSPPGSRVEVRAVPGRIEVLDRGPGLAPGEEETVMERFHRGSAGRQGPAGTGLGLPIAQELAREWGGEVRLENRDGGGARAVLEWEES